jgi:hypothetical protein
MGFKRQTGATSIFPVLGEITMGGIWAFLQDEANRTVLGWIGGGIVVVAGGFWAVFKFLFAKREPEASSPPTVSATGGGVAAGRDMRNNTIDTRGDRSARSRASELAARTVWLD